jgi:predicted nucleotidyltransferase
MLAILHGSRATGDAHERSDWDIGVFAEHPLSPEDREVLRQSFAAKLHVPVERVDIAELRSASPLLRYRAAMHGNLIEGDRGDLRRFQITAWKDYLNNEKIFDLQARFLTKTLL